MNKPSFKVAILAMFTSFTLILSYVEFLIPISYGYGLKLGLANIAIVAILYTFSAKEAFIVSILRIFIIGIWFGNGISLILSLAGGILSLTIMTLIKRCKMLTVITVSIIGALCHNVGQLVAAYFVTSVPGLMFYLPVLMIGGLITGAVIGIISKIIIKALKEILKNDSIYKG